MLEELLTTLTPRQQEAVSHSLGPLLILAGAGTGKSTTITAKIACMIEKQGIAPDKILALTFSREAARNMERKVRDLLGQGVDVKVSTFHAFCAELIRENAEICGVSDHFTIFEEIDAAILIYKELNTTSRTAALYANTIAKAKDLNISIDQFKEYLETKKAGLFEFVGEEAWEQFYTEFRIKLNTFHLKNKDEQKTLKAEKKDWQTFISLCDEFRKYRDFISAWELYEERKSVLNCLDYGDLNRIALAYLDTHGADELNDSYTHIIVDEFQDTNYVQFELIRHLTAKEQNITVVADENQTIYAFRGAYSNNIEEFKEQFGISDQDVVSLDVSFRSTNKILRVAHGLIEQNYPEERKSECLLLKNCDNREGKNVVIQETQDEGEEARKIVEQIDAYIKGGIKEEVLREGYFSGSNDGGTAEATGTGVRVPLKEIAVLYRTHAQGRAIRQALQKRGIPVIVRDDADYLKQPEIKTVLSYLYVLNNLMDPTPRGTEAWWRLFHYNNCLENGDSVRIGEFIKKRRASFQEAIYHHLGELGLSEAGVNTVERVKAIIETLSERRRLTFPTFCLRSTTGAEL